MLLDTVVPLQDFASFVHGLLANRVGREGTWKLLRDRWSAVGEKTAQGPMLLRRVVEALGNLRERRHLDEARAFLEAHPVPEAQQAVAQTPEGLGQGGAGGGAGRGNRSRGRGEGTGRRGGRGADESKGSALDHLERLSLTDRASW